MILVFVCRNMEVVLVVAVVVKVGVIPLEEGSTVIMEEGLTPTEVAMMKSGVELLLV